MRRFIVWLKDGSQIAEVSEFIHKEGHVTLKQFEKTWVVSEDDIQSFAWDNGRAGIFKDGVYEPGR